MKTPRAIIGLGNPGSRFIHHRHNIGFQILDVLAQQFHGSWSEKKNMAFAKIVINDHPTVLVKPLTFMNESGKVIPTLAQQGIACDAILVVHDELELPFGQVKFRVGGSARGHNGLKSIINACGLEFGRLRCGIGRPDDRNAVPDYVLSNFSQSKQDVDEMIHSAIRLIEEMYK